MHLFIVRVELHNASYLDYETLHSAMGKVGFSRIITADNGTKYHLPTAEYVMSSSSARSTILSLATHAAANTGKVSGILATEAVGCSFEGLVLVR